MIEMFVTGVALDIRSNIPLVILNDAERNATLPIWIGQAEANAIARALEETESLRPMTHDLMTDVFENLEVELESVEINSFEETTFFAALILKTKDGTEICVDSRPSDAIALALRNDAPIYVSESIVEDVAANIEVLTESEHKNRKAAEQQSLELEEEAAADEDFEIEITLEDDLDVTETAADISNAEFKEFLKYVKASDFSLDRSE